MTVAGATALSVETSTNARARRNRRRSPSASRVASALLRTASIGLSSISADVLVGGGVEHDLGPVLGEDLAHALFVLAVGQHGDREADVALADELALDLEQVRLAVVDQHERLGFTRAIWRHSSEPIDPPAPVTSTQRPVR